jgi:hypothetical protein
MTGAQRYVQSAWKVPIMFKVFEFKEADSTHATEVGRGYPTREQAMTAVRVHLKKFNATLKPIIGGSEMQKACGNTGYQVSTKSSRC